jgi:drug/metabolite transporter (DMT)-like permease
MPHLFPWAATAQPIVALLVGAALLLFGRRLFWLFVGVVGFMAGWYFAVGSWHHPPSGGLLLLALAAGVVGIVLALVAQKLAVAVAGFVFGWSAAAWMLGWQMTMLHPSQMLVLGAAGVVAALLALLLFDFTLILYSAVAGASLILEPVVRLGNDARLVLLVVLVVIGVAVQSRWLERGRRA